MSSVDAGTSAASRHKTVHRTVECLLLLLALRDTCAAYVASHTLPCHRSTYNILALQHLRTNINVNVQGHTPGPIMSHSAGELHAAGAVVAAAG